MDKSKLLKNLEAAWTALLESYAGLTDVEMMRNGVIGEWSVKDIIAHVTAWEEEALKHLPTILAGKRPPRYLPQPTRPPRTPPAPPSRWPP